MMVSARVNASLQQQVLLLYMVIQVGNKVVLTWDQGVGWWAANVTQLPTAAAQAGW